MTIKKLAKILSEKEGMKDEVNIAQISELLAHLSDMLWADDDNNLLYCMMRNGEKREQKKAKAEGRET